MLEVVGAEVLVVVVLVATNTLLFVTGLGSVSKNGRIKSYKKIYMCSDT